MPFPKPDKLPRWATVPVDNGPNHTPNVQEPPEAKKDIGWNFLEKPPRQWVNWLALKAYQWLLWAEESIDEIYSIITGGLIPPGFMGDYAGGTVPNGWLLCDGSAVSRATYANLFAAIGTTWGAGDGSTTFNVPDYRGRNAIGAGQGIGLSNRVLGQYGGEETHKLTIPEIPSHTHSYLYLITTGVSAVGGGPPNQTGNFTTGATGGDQPHNNMQPFAVATRIIKT